MTPAVGDGVRRVETKETIHLAAPFAYRGTSTRNDSKNIALRGFPALAETGTCNARTGTRCVERIDQHLPLLFALSEAVLVLHGNELRPLMQFRGVLHRRVDLHQVDAVGAEPSQRHIALLDGCLAGESGIRARPQHPSSSEDVRMTRAMVRV